MASIIKRKKNYSIVYNYTDENGETRQKWETRTSYQDALKRKAEVENQQFTGTFLPPSNQTIQEFLLDFVSLYGEKRWGVSMYDSQNSLIANYINPIIGGMKVQEVTPWVVDKYIQTLQKTPSVATRTHKPKYDIGSGKPCGSASEVPRAGKYPGRTACGDTGRQISPKIPISKNAIFLSKCLKIVQIQLASIQREMHVFLLMTECQPMEEMIRKTL